LSSEGSKSVRDKFTSGDLKKIINSNNIVLLDFYATWCIPCMKMKPALDTLSKQSQS
jgi:thiol-disulfide isomerase/thioredoxin